ncbi:MAG: hypothetical protein ACOH1O_06515 [Flavobacterium sp.]
MEKIKSIKMTNSQLSVALILVNLFLIYILSKIGKNSNDPDGILTYAYLISASAILFGGFAFTYHGKPHRWAKWLFGLSVFVAVIFFGFILYVTALAGAYQH